MLTIAPVRSFFSYCPRSGSRIIARNTGVPGVCAMTLANGSTLIAGRLVELVYPAARPGLWWRDLAGKLATDIVAAVGGAAEDCQGTVTLWVPPDRAGQAHALMVRARPKWDEQTIEADEQNMLALWSAGAAGLDERLGWHPRAVASNEQFATDHGGYWLAGLVRRWVDVDQGDDQPPKRVAKQAIRFGVAHEEWIDTLSVDLSDRGMVGALDTAAGITWPEHATREHSASGTSIFWTLPWDMVIDEHGNQIVSPEATPAEAGEAFEAAMSE